ncbi:murein hydrolase activator EnvC family protein [Flavisolibacter tropicus]|uniref:murein hydrolase activator EnvC family protein n=1 Tax=Flavisolibacter tropicus TaxID=1492898 RepID=UPI00083197DD|nr:M23 family metallopeptidase [Flavisolibacter tropicus]
MKKTAIIILNLFFGIAAFAQQDKSKLQNERDAIRKELSDIQTIYNQVKGQRKESIGQLNLIQKKVNLQNQYVNNINQEIHLINDDIYLSAKEIIRLQVELDTLKSQYAKSVIYAYKNRSTYDYLNFIFSASTFNDALKRVSYLRSYRAYRQKQVENIKEMQALITDRKQQLLGKKTQKNAALQNQTKQLAELETQKKEKDAVVAKLKSKESELSKEIAAKKKRDQQLRNQIAAVIKRELEAARKKAAEEAVARRKREEEDRRKAKEAEAAIAKANAAKNNAPASNNNVTTGSASKGAETVTAPATTTTAKASEPKENREYRDLTAVDAKLSSSFAGNKGSLPWPVKGFISIPFGTSKVEGTSLTQDNPGITISTESAGATVSAVFDGEVSAVSNLGDGMAVFIRHGKYFTIYSNLSSVSVSKGAVVKTGQAIGRTAAADDGTGGQLDFMLMIENSNVNPASWLRR